MGQLELTSRRERKKNKESRRRAKKIYFVYRITPKRILSSGLDGLRFGIIKDISIVKKSQSLLKRLTDRVGRHSRSDDMNCKRRCCCCCGSSSFSLFHQRKKHINISISFGQKELHARDNTTRHKGEKGKDRDQES